MTTPKPKVPNPCSDEALDLGCACAVLDNGHGKLPDPAYWVVNLDCPLHGLAGAGTKR